jgi:hypothetical protein
MTELTFEAAEAARRAADEEWAFWHQNLHAYLKKYPDQFVAVFGGAVVAANADLGALLADLRAQGLDVKRVWIRFFAANPVVQIL